MLNNLIKDDIVEQLKLRGRASYLITENREETLLARWDGDGRFSIIHILVRDNKVKTIILNPREASEAACFIQTVLEMTKEVR